MCRVIGMDFDNTVVDYEALWSRLAVERGLMPPGAEHGKKAIRDRIRQLPLGELEWQKLQALVYGSRIDEATTAPEVQAFFDCCRREQVRVCIISHKTPYATMDETGINLREAALAWMRDQRFFEADGLGLSQTDVYFESTRREKLARIGMTGCTHFIDDLEETFQEESFPPNVDKILYSPYATASLPGVRVLRTWRDIREYVFDDGR